MTVVTSTQTIGAWLGNMVPTHISTPKTGYISDAALAIVGHVIVFNQLNSTFMDQIEYLYFV